MPASGVWQLAGGKRRALVYFFYRDEARRVDEPEPALQLGPFRLARGDRDVCGRFDGLVVLGTDETTSVCELLIDGVPAWAGPATPGEGEVLESPRPMYVHARSVVTMKLRGSFERVMLIVEGAQPVNAPKEGVA